MQRVVMCEMKISGAKKFSGILPQPASKWDFYRDIVVLAFRTPDGEGVNMKSHAPKISSSAMNSNGDASTFVTLPTNHWPQFIQLEFAQPFATRSIMVNVGKGAGMVKAVIQASDDSQKFRDLRELTTPAQPPRPLTFTTHACEDFVTDFKRRKLEAGKTG